MVKEIEQALLGNLDWLVTRFKVLAVKLIGFVLTCWLVIAVFGIGLVLPAFLVNASLFHGNDGKIIASKGDQVNRAANQVHYQAPMVVRNSVAQPVARNKIRNATN